MKEIYSISITYNPDIALLNRQIESLYSQVQGIVIVDNGSANFDELNNYLISKQNDIKREFIVIYNNKNTGLGYAQNTGIKTAIQNGASDILLLDQDSVLEENLIINLIADREILEKDYKRVGAMGPVYYSEITNQAYPITKFWGPFIKRLTPTTLPEEASFLIASGCLINNNVIKDVGMMNEELFIDFIDIDWCFRARAKGYSMYASPKAKMMHTIGEKRMNVAGRSIAVHSPLRRYYLFRNSIFMVRDKNIPIGYKVREITFNTLRLIVYFSVSRDRFKYLKYSVSGFIDGIKGIGGECSHKF